MSIDDTVTPWSSEDEDLERQQSAAAHGRQLRNGIISLFLLGALVVGLLLAIPGLDGVERALRRVEVGTVLGAIGLEFLSCMGYVAVFQLVFARAPRRFAARLAWTEMAFGSALSVGGAGSLAIGAWVLHTRGVPTDRIARRSAVLFMLTSAINIIVLVVAGVALGLGLVPGTTNWLLSWLPAAVGASVFVLFLCIPAWSRWFLRDREPRKRITKIFIGFAESITDTRQMLVTADWRLLGGYLYLLADIAVLYVCLDAVGVDLPLASVVVAYQVGYLTNIIPVPGGIGVLETGLVGMLVLFGAPAAPAAAGVLIYHAIALWVTTAFGTVAFLLLRRTIGQPLTPLPLPEPRSRRRTRRRERRARERT